MTIKVVKLTDEKAETNDPEDFYQSDEYEDADRSCYVVYLNDINDYRRVQESNQKMYVEATFPAVKEVGYEAWVVKTFYPEC